VGTSSARPDNLEDFARRSRAISGELQESAAPLLSIYNEFLSENQWGHFDAGSLLQGYRTYIHDNEFDASWVATVAAAFRHAGAGDGIARLPDLAIKASLRAAGLDRDRRSVTFDDPVAYGFPPTTGYTDDPINTATGNFVTRETDLVCGGLAEDLSFARTYNSRSDRVGPFGRGWASWATARLVARPDGAAYVGPDGQEALFARMGDGYGRVAGVGALVEPLACGLALSWFDGRRWEFDDAGLPVSVSRGPGTEVRLDHDAGRLVELARGGGRRVRLQWDEEIGRIVALECSDGRRAAYRYGASHDLVAVDTAGATRRYDLDEAGRVQSIVDADGVIELANTYDDDGRVLEQRSPYGRRTQIGYLPGRVAVTMDDDVDGPVNTYVHDGVGRLLAIVDGDDRQLSLIYDEWGNPVSLTERNGAVTVQEWDARARPVRRVLPTGAELTFAYDDADRVVEIAVSTTGAATRFSYVGDERIPAQIVDPEGGVTRLTVQDGLVRRFVDPDGVVLDFEFDADGNPVAAIDADGNRGWLERDAAGRVTAAITPLGRRTEISYDGRGLPAERRDPSGGLWRYEHTAAGRLASVTDPTGAREERRYGEHGSVETVIDALGNATAREYDVFGNVVGVVEPDGARWEYAYDAVMRLTLNVDPTGARWRQEYDVNGVLVARIDPAGVRTSVSVDAFGRVVGVCDGLTSEHLELDALGRTVALCRGDGSRTRAEYDLCNRRTRIEDAAGAVTRVQHTPGGRVARVVFPSGRADTFEYDRCGRVVAGVDGAGRRWEQRYDADGQIVQTRLPTGEVERLRYDDDGRLAARSAPGEGETTYAYDAVGRTAAITDRVAGARRFGYDPAGRLVEATDANGATTRYAYNERGWATQIVDPLGGTITRRYDAVGRIVEQTDQLGRSATMTYDAAGRPRDQIDASGRTLRRCYDVAGRIVSFGPADAAGVTIEYDALGMPIAIREPGAFANWLRWDAEGRLVERSRGDLSMRWTYDADGELAAIGYPDGTATTYMHDAGGYVIGAQHPALGAIELQRDAAGRLVGASAEGMRARWRYDGGDLAHYELRAGGRLRIARLSRDSSGRVVRAMIDGEEHEFAYDAAGQLVSSVTVAGARSFRYDANGRLAREESPAGVVEYAHDAAGQLLARSGAGGGVTRYEYDGAGRRVVEVGGGLERRYRWDELGRLAAVDRCGVDGEPTESVRVAVDALGELAELDGTPLMWDSAHPLQPLTWIGGEAVVGEGAPWALAGDGAARWLAPDWQGTVGDLPRDPWGAAPGPVAAGPRLGYRGEVEFDGETWLRHRIYEPATRSFPQPDPLLPVPATASAANRYHYAANNPIGLSDPLGLRPITDHELQAYRNRMGHNALQKIGDDVVDAGKALAAPVYDNAGTISAVAGGLALFPPLTPFLAPVAVGFGVVAAAHSLHSRNYLGAGLDIAGIIPGVAGISRAGRAAKGLEQAKRAEALRNSLTVKIGKEQSELWKVSTHRRLADAEALERTARRNDRQAFAAATGAVVVAKVVGHKEHEEPNPLEYLDDHRPHRLTPIHLAPDHP
jgi:RHS repeat-associated protein